MARLEKRMITGKSGEQYRFNIYPGDMRFNDFIPGVFYLFSSEDGVEQPVYIEGTPNVDVTLRDHPRAQDFSDANYNRIGFHMNASQEVRDRIVADLLPALSPSCNS